MRSGARQIAHWVTGQFDAAAILSNVVRNASGSSSIIILGSVGVGVIPCIGRGAGPHSCRPPHSSSGYHLSQPLQQWLLVGCHLFQQLLLPLVLRACESVSHFKSWFTSSRGRGEEVGFQFVPFFSFLQEGTQPEIPTSGTMCHSLLVWVSLRSSGCAHWASQFAPIQSGFLVQCTPSWGLQACHRLAALLREAA